MQDVQIVDRGTAAAVTCSGTYTGPKGVVTLGFLRVWLRRDGRGRIIAASVSR